MNPHSHKNKKYIVFLIAAAIVSILLSGRIEYWMPENVHMDMTKYRMMAEASPSLNTDVIQPYIYRIFGPWLAGVLPIHLDISFYILNVLSLLLMSISFYELIKVFGIKQRTAFALTFALIFNRYFFQFLAWDYFHLSDSLSYGLLFFSLLLLTKQKWMWIALLSIIGVMTREVALLVVPVGYAYLYQMKFGRKKYIQFTMAVLPACVVFVLLRIVIVASGGDDLITKFFEEGGAYFFTPAAIGKKFFIAFTPFALVPVLFYKELLVFIKTNLALSVLFLSTVFATLFGLDYERLMTTAAPAYFIFLGFIIDKYLSEEKETNSKRKFLLWVMLFAFLSSFYHLWGILQLQNSNITLISTLTVIIITGFHFLSMKYDRLRFHYAKQV